MSSTFDITVCIPTILARSDMLQRAVQSVERQTLQPAKLIVTVDRHWEGAAATRNRAFDQVETPLVAFLDDDDEFLPEHLERLHQEIERTRADLVYPWFHVIGGGDPFPGFFNMPWDNSFPHQTTITFLARTQAIRDAGGFIHVGADGGVDPDGNRAGEEYRMVLRMMANGCKIVHLPERTWLWHHHGGNTSGLASRIDGGHTRVNSEGLR